MKSTLAVIAFNLKSLPARAGGSISIVVGIAVVAAVLCGALAIAAGYRGAFSATGRPDVAIVLSQGADAEFGSTLTQQEVNTINQAPGVAQNSSGPLVAPDVLDTLKVHYRDRPVSARMVLRGVAPAMRELHPEVKLVAGRWFKPGVGELVVGEGAAAKFRQLAIGSKIQGDSKTWTVVGMFSAPGTAFASEAWTGTGDVQDASGNAAKYSAAYVKLSSAGAFPAFKQALDRNPQLAVNVEREQAYYAKQSNGLAELITDVGGIAALLMGIAAIFGAMSTLYTAIANRSREIATLRAIGFGRVTVLSGVLAESLFLALLGGVVGAGLAYAFLNGFSASTLATNGSVSNHTPQVAFAFAVTFGVMAVGIAWALIMGFVGGLFPAIRAARLPIVVALRDA